MSSWLVAALWGLLAGGALVLGAVVSLLVELPHRVIAGAMGFGSGVLVCILGTELMKESSTAGGLAATLGSFVAGTAIFSGANWLLSKRGAQHRNRCGDCVTQPRETDVPGSGLAIALGALLDGIPESLVIGLNVQNGEMRVALIAGFFLANLPQGLSSASGMKQAGRGAPYILSIWGGIAVLSMVAAGVGVIALAGATPQLKAIIQAIAAGAVLAMLAEGMIPEAFEKAQSFIGLITAVGFFAAYLASESL